MDAFIVNCKPDSWKICNKHTIFGLKDTNSLPPLAKGDLILFRISGPNYGLKALWYFDYAKKVVNQKNILLFDDDYTWILNCKEILTLPQRFSEEFQTSSKKSSKITDLYAGGIQRAVVAIKKPQLRDYIFHILKEYKNESNVNINYLGEEVNANELLQKILAEIVTVEPFPESDENEINEPISVKKEKSDKQIPEQKEKQDKPASEPKHEPEKPVLVQEKELGKQISEQKEKHDKPAPESKHKPDKPIQVQDKVSDKQISEPKEKLNKPASEPKHEPEKPVLVQEKELDKQISEQKEKHDKAEIELEEVVDGSNSEKEEDLDEYILELQEDIDEPGNKVLTKTSKQQLDEQIGERVNLPILNYAPLNKKGIILLFGYYMQKLGISHVEEIKAGFPDVIAIRSTGNGRFQRVRIGFAYNSSSLLEKGHKITDCDLIVCWKHDCNNCSIEVIELSKVLFNK